MARQVGETSFGPGSPEGSAGPPRRRAPRALIPIVTVLALLAAGGTGVVLVNPGLVVDRFFPVGASGAEAGCRDTTITVAAAPEVAPAVEAALRPAAGSRLTDGSCLDVQVRRQPSAVTAAATSREPVVLLPQVWVPDSSLWLARTSTASVQPAGSFATSPVVIATSRGAVGALGWGTRQPSWLGAVTSGRAVAVPDLASSAIGLLAVLGLRASAGGGITADQAVAATVLAAQRAGTPTPEAALAAAADGTADAPLVPASEQTVFAQNRASNQPSLVAVYPSDGSPSLDYPIVRVAAGQRSATEREATDLLVRALQSPAAHDLASREGFRQPGLTGPQGSGLRPGAVSALAIPPAAQIQALLDRLSTLAEPIRMLTLVDVSPSMGAQATATTTRIQLVRDAAKEALQLLPDSNQVGVWAFSANLAPGVDHVPVVATRGLGEKVGTGTQRRAILAALDALPQQLRGTGTALYRTTLDAVDQQVTTYDPAVSNVVVLLTDGSDENAPGLDQATLLTRLKDLETTPKPVRLIAVGIGPTADMAALRAMVAATPNGKAYQATDAQALRSVLFDALSSRR